MGLDKDSVFLSKVVPGLGTFHPISRAMLQGRGAGHDQCTRSVRVPLGFMFRIAAVAEVRAAATARAAAYCVRSVRRSQRVRYRIRCPPMYSVLDSLRVCTSKCACDASVPRRQRHCCRWRCRDVSVRGPSESHPHRKSQRHYRGAPLLGASCRL